MREEPLLISYSDAIGLLDRHIIKLGKFIREKTSNDPPLKLKINFSIDPTMSNTSSNISDVDILLNLIKEKEILQEFEKKELKNTCHKFQIFLLTPLASYYDKCEFYHLTTEYIYMPPKFSVLVRNCFGECSKSHNGNFDIPFEKCTSKLAEYKQYLFIDVVFEAYKNQLRNCCIECLQQLKNAIQNVDFPSEYLSCYTELYCYWQKQTDLNDISKRLTKAQVNELVEIVIEKCQSKNGGKTI